MSQFAQHVGRTRQQSAPARAQPGAQAEALQAAGPVDARARLLRLQRMVGNQAVGRLLAQQQAAGPPARSAAPASAGVANGTTLPIQRLVGFEVELSVPTFRAGKALAMGKPWNPDNSRRTADPKIRQFLTGGLPYNTPIANIKTPKFNDNIELKADHDRLSDDGLDLYEVLIGKSAPPPEGSLVPQTGYVALSNLEYATGALDEMEPGSNPRFKALADMIDTHVASIMANLPEGRVTNIPNSSPATQTGIPLMELFSWTAGPRRGAAFPDDVDQAITKLMNHVTWYMSPQATVGIPPSSLPDVYESQQYRSPPEVETTWTRAQHDAVKAIVDGVNRLFAVKGASREIDAWLQGSQPIDRRAFTGAIYLALSHAIGQGMLGSGLLEGSTKKNAVQLLVKVADLGAVYNASTTNWIRRYPPSPALLSKIGRWLSKNVPQTTAAYWQGDPYNAGAPSKKRSAFTTGVADPSEAIGAFLIKLLTGTGKLDTVRPGRKLPGPDVVSPHIGGAKGTSGQSGIPLEYRWLPTHPSGPGQLWQVFQAVLGEVRYAQLKYRSKSDFDAVFESLGSFD